MFGWLKDLFRRPGGRQARARGAYDAAQRDRLNERHWQMADGLSAVAANSPDVRRNLRERSRYESDSSGYVGGMIDTQANYTIGAGPTLQLTYRGEGDATDELREAAERVEWLFAQWAKERKLTAKLHQMHKATDRDGEAFALKTSTPPRRFGTPVTLNFRVYECDQFELPIFDRMQSNEFDSGIRTNADGEPIEYAMLRDHPGDNSASLQPLDFEWVPADLVLHMFRQERPGQLRGIPRTTSTLQLWAIHRRYTLAAVTAAESAADVAAVLEKDFIPGEEYANDPNETPMEIDFHRGMIMELPDGSKVSQIKAEQPTTTYDQFDRALVREGARGFNQPAVLALGDASGYNYASGRLDIQSFGTQVRVDRLLQTEEQVLDPLYSDWLEEALLIEDFLPEVFRQEAMNFAASFRWPEPEHVDRQKEAAGQQIELQNKTTTLARESARRGEDWLTNAKELKVEIEHYRRNGMRHPADLAGTTEGANNAGDTESNEEGEATEQENAAQPV